MGRPGIVPDIGPVPVGAGSSGTSDGLPVTAGSLPVPVAVVAGEDDAGLVCCPDGVLPCPHPEISAVTRTASRAISTADAVLRSGRGRGTPDTITHLPGL